MTEAEWLTSREIRSIFLGASLGERTRSKRNWRLCACGCCRLIWSKLTDPRSRNAVEVAEQFVDDETTVSVEDYQAVHEAAMDAADELRLRPRPINPERDSHTVWPAMVAVGATAALGSAEFKMALHWAGDVARQLGLRAMPIDFARDIFGNPFRPVTFSPEWRTTTAIALARTMYESREFSAMPILADAIQDAGCDDATILSHCRGQGPHVRGCWVVDLVLGKE